MHRQPQYPDASVAVKIPETIPPMITNKSDKLGMAFIVILRAPLNASSFSNRVI